jgi:hypothetical protein
MQSRSRVSRVLAASVLVVAIAVLAACSSSNSPTTPGSSPTTGAAPSSAAATPTSSGSGSGSAAMEQVTTNWESFFNGATSADKKISLLQNGQAFASTIRAQAGLSLSKSITAKVTSVTVNSTGTQATVKYSLLASGASVLPNQTGTAVNEGGAWKVGDASFCALLALQNGGKAPQVCSSAG